MSSVSERYVIHFVAAGPTVRRRMTLGPFNRDRSGIQINDLCAPFFVPRFWSIRFQGYTGLSRKRAKVCTSLRLQCFPYNVFFWQENQQLKRVAMDADSRVEQLSEEMQQQSQMYADKLKASSDKFNKITEIYTKLREDHLKVLRAVSRDESMNWDEMYQHCTVWKHFCTFVF